MIICRLDVISHKSLSRSTMHQWRDMEEKFWDCLATGSHSCSKGRPLITALVGPTSNPPTTKARLGRSITGSWETRNSEPGLNFKVWWSVPPNNLTIWLLVTEVIVVTVSLNLLPYDWLFYRYEEARSDFLLAGSWLFDPTDWWCALFFGMEGSIVGHLRHGCATTARAIRAAIQQSQATTVALSQGLGINVKMVAKWRKRETVEDPKIGPTKPKEVIAEIRTIF